jgi:sialidase-1
MRSHEWRVLKTFAVLACGMVLCWVCVGGVTNNLWSTPDRIPLLLVAPNGGLLAFAEDRIVIDSADTGYINCTLRRSMNNGATWTSQQTIGTDGVNTFSVGAAVLDPTTHRIYFFMGWNGFGDSWAEIDSGTSTNTRLVYLTHSDDSGTNWSAPVNVTASIKPSGTRAHGPGVSCGIALASGRLLAPMYFGTDATHYYSYVVYSDDHGTNWTIGGTNAAVNYSENSLIELTNGAVMMVARNDRTDSGKGFIGITTSTDFGATWAALTNTALNDPACQISCIRYTKPPDYGRARLLLSNPSSPWLTGSDSARTNVTVRISYDEGWTWSVAKKYYSGKSAYTSLAVLTNGDWGMLVENGSKTYCDKITFISDTLSNLTAGADALDPQTNSPPPLSITSSGTKVLVSWPASATGFSLQQNLDLTTNGWTNAAGAGPLEVTNGERRLSLLPTNAKSFFRLKNP